jgi:phosphopantothenoylcysteine decarboxylase / phosphopantothenate---cysteine ligase
MHQNPDIFVGKKILLGITGGIAAYKTPQLIREFTKRGAEVRVAATPSALKFVTPLTLSTVSQNAVVSDIFSEDNSGTWHISLSEWSDIFIIAPATVNTIAKIAHGFADNALTTLALASRCPIIVCPAADMDMYQNPITLQNIEKLKSVGMYILDAETGELASGLKGIGRLPELTKIVETVETVLYGYKNLDLSGKKIVVTAGPTYEDIDPVRFLGNRSSGKMGFALAKAAALRGAEVTLIHGPSSEASYQNIKNVSVRTAKDMYQAVAKAMVENDTLIMAAAVADFTPEKVAKRKIKKTEDTLNLELVATTDILSAIQKENKIVVGFALETDSEEVNALKKMDNKQLDMIILNSLQDKNSGFEYDTNQVTIYRKETKPLHLPLMSKFQTAHKILDVVFS